jgi:hypothetical protein
MSLPSQSDTPTRDGRAKWPEAPCKGLPSDKATHIEEDDFGVERQSLLFDWHGRSDLVTSRPIREPGGRLVGASYAPSGVARKR